MANLFYLEKKHDIFTLKKIKQILENQTISKSFDVNIDNAIHKTFKKACESCIPTLKNFNIEEDLFELKKGN